MSGARGRIGIHLCRLCLWHGGRHACGSGFGRAFDRGQQPRWLLDRPFIPRHSNMRWNLSELNLPFLILELVECSYSLNQDVSSRGTLGFAIVRKEA
jgi:hypothetical protein